MHLNFHAVLNFRVKKLDFKFLKRHVGNSRITWENNEEQCGKPKEKISVVRKKIDDQKTTILEWKPASEVVKRFNWENRNLFGPVLPSKHNTVAELTLNTNQIIQHETQIPLIEPPDDFKLQKFDPNSILNFPLKNKSVHSTIKVNKVNCLRKHLELLCSYSSIPSVSMILQKTMPQERVEILDRWKHNMIAQLGEEGFEKYQRELLENGTSLHHSISSFLSSTPESELYVKQENIGHWKSLKHIFPNMKDVKLLEEFVNHPFLCYRGVVDCFAYYKDVLVVIDWKTSKKAKNLIKDTYDHPLQIAAYVGALNFDPKFQYLASKGLIVIAYENGNPATAHYINEVKMEHYWTEWLKRLKVFWEMKDSETKNS